jgi:uncharacterized protein
MSPTSRSYTAFADSRRVASGSLVEVAAALKDRLDAGELSLALLFDDATGEQLDVDLRGDREQVLAAAAHHSHERSREEPQSPPRAGPGRPRLGVVSREVSLLPRHWAWLGEQPGGASAALRRLTEEARKRGEDPLRARRAREAADRFLWATAGNARGAEEISRAIYAGDAARVRALASGLAPDLASYLLRLLDGATPGGTAR